MIYRIKDKKVGEGTYAVVYQGKRFLVHTTHHLPTLMKMFSCRQRSFNRKKGRYKENKSRPIQGWFGHVSYPRGEVSTRIEASKHHRGA